MSNSWQSWVGTAKFVVEALVESELFSLLIKTNDEVALFDLLNGDMISSVMLFLSFYRLSLVLVVLWC